MAKHKLYIKDNMIAMQEMLDSGIKVDMIYADPLYNADNKFFKAYDDNVQEWTEFMRPRLELAKNLLTDMGLIFLSINEDGLFDLKPLCDEIFGKKNKIALFAVKTANQTEGRNVIKNTEYLLEYAKTEQGHLYHDPKRQEARCTTSKESQSPNYVSIPAGVRVENVADGTYTDADIKKIGSNEDLELKKGPIIVKNHRLQSEIQLYGRWSNPTDVRNWANKFKSGSNENVYNKYGKELIELYLYGMRFQPRMIKSGFEVPYTFIDKYTSKGKNQLKEVIGETNFTYPKDISFIKHIIKMGTNGNDSVVLDFFAGSGTTLQAVVELNDEENSNLQCILINKNENNIIKDVTLNRALTLKTGVRPDGTKYSDGMNFNLEIL